MSDLNDHSIDRFVLILESDVFDGVLPPFPDALTAAVIMVLPFLRDYPEHEVQKWAALLHRALVKRIAVTYEPAAEAACRRSVIVN
jgi:hypothetical protein